MAIGTANAKTIFFGEHFVVYGVKAIGFALDRKIEIEVKESPRFEIGFDADEKTKAALEVLKNLLGRRNFRITIKNSDIPVAGGLGSSAALSVATIRAISNEFSLELSNKKICALAFEAEKVFHGTPSGIDNTLATFGGALVFQKNTENNLIERLQIGSPMHLVMVDSGIKSATKAMVEKTRAFKENNETVFSRILNIESLVVEEAILAIKSGDHEKLGALMNVNHGLLKTIGASHPENEKIVEIARENRALGAKVVGAGGGGFCAALMANQESALNLVRILEKRYQCFYNLVPAN